MKDEAEDEKSEREEARSVRPRRPHWRFESLEICNKAVDLALKFHRIAERLDKRRLYRYARTTTRRGPVDFQ
jgi:hypothetical protein